MHLALAPIALAPARAAMPSRASLGSRAPLAPRPVATPARRARHRPERGVLLAPRAALPDPAAVNDALFQLAGNANELVEGGARSSMNTSQVEQEVLDALKNNEFLPRQTFETFLAKKMGRGKRTLFLNKD